MKTLESHNTERVFIGALTYAFLAAKEKGDPTAKGDSYEDAKAWEAASWRNHLRVYGVIFKAQGIPLSFGQYRATIRKCRAES